MRDICSRALVICAIASLLGCATGDAGPDVAYISGGFYTLRPDRLWVEAVAIQNGRFVAVGTNQQVLEKIGKQTEIVDLKGAFVIPGLHDPHDHGIEIADDALKDYHLQLTDGSSADEIVAAIADFARAHPDLPIISAGDYPFGMFPGDDGPKEMLDEAEPNRPVLVMNQGGHTLWVNSKALEAVGITSESEDPPYGIIPRKPGTTEPLGSLHEAAMLPVLALKPPSSPEQLHRAAVDATHTLNSFGITSSKIAGGTQPMLDGLTSADRAGELTARITFAFHWRTSFITVKPETDVLREQILAARSMETSHVKTHSVKYYVDAAPASKTAAVLEAYENDPDNFGLLNIEPSELNSELIFWDEHGINAMMHSVGDRAVRVSLDAIEAARRANGKSGVRHHVSHNVLVDPGDYGRFNELGAVMDFSPMLAYPSPAHANHLQFFGAARLERWWPLKAYRMRASNSPSPRTSPFLPTIPGAPSRRTTPAGTHGTRRPARWARTRPSTSPR